MSKASRQLPFFTVIFVIGIMFQWMNVFQNISFCQIGQLLQIELWDQIIGLILDEWFQSIILLISKNKKLLPYWYMSKKYIN